jgi:GDP dissociation inhibitor
VHSSLLYSVNQRQQPPSPARLLATIVAYLKQAGAYVDGQAPFIECSYGCGEVAQAAIRACCVHGGAMALDRAPETALVHGGRVQGVRMADGHVVRCGALAALDSVLLGFAPGGSAPESQCAQQSAEAGSSDESVRTVTRPPHSILPCCKLCHIDYIMQLAIAAACILCCDFATCLSSPQRAPHPGLC